MFKFNRFTMEMIETNTYFIVNQQRTLLRLVGDQY